jgi:hypothetical protein
VKELEREVKQLRQANEILKLATSLCSAAEFNARHAPSD